MTSRATTGTASAGKTDGAGAQLSGREGLEVLGTRLRAGLNTYFPDLYEGEARVVGRSVGGRYAKTFRFEIAAAGKKRVAYAKICPVYESLDPARVEYDTLVFLHERIPMAERRLAVARPIAYFPDISAYIMESVGTQDMRTYLLRSNSARSTSSAISGLVDAVSGSARWLAVFHALTGAGKTCRFDAEKFVEALQDEYDYRQLRAFTFSVATLNLVEKALGGLDAFAGMTMPCAKWHWDYTPGHVFLDGGRVSVIDILGLDDTPVYEDVGHFLAALTTTNNLPFYPFYDFRRARTLLCDAFLNEYCAAGGVERRVFMILSDIFRLKYLIGYFNGQCMLASQKTHPTLARVFANLRLTSVFEAPLAETARAIVHQAQRA